MTPSKALGLFALSAAVVAVADQAAKLVVRHSLVLCSAPPVDLCDRRTVMGPIGLLRTENGSSAFGVVGGDILPVLLILALILVAMQARRAPMTGPVILGVGLQVGGFAGNLLDRLTTGAVTDFVDLRWADGSSLVINPADVALAVGGAILATVFYRTMAPARLT
jgi:signal peptidase II